MFWKTRSPLSLVVLFLGSQWAAAAEVALNGHVFTLPDGFEIRLVGSAPVVNRPITADFDEQGRLYVSDSSGSNDKVQEQLEKKPHRILRLEDTDGDGVFDRQVVFADRMMFPEGTMWHDGSLYVSAPPSIWKLTDTTGDGVADERVEWYLGKTLTGCANDLHGPYWGLDGWIYWCKGAFAEQTHQVHGREWKTKASHIFRCRPDGSGIEPVMTGGMDNPVDVAFLPNGDRVLSNTFIVHPGNGQRDGLLHVIYGGVYGKDHGVLEGHPRTGELMPILAHMGPAAACGLTRYESTTFGGEFQDNLFCSQFNKHLVSRHVLQPQGASWKSVDSDFVVSNNTDFHPTDVLLDADGSLLIVDTGGWYKLCCPSSQLHKPDILGGIYRVTKRGASVPEDSRGQKIDWSSPALTAVTSAGTASPALVKLAQDPRPVVRRRAQEQIARLQLALPDRSPSPLDALIRENSVHQSQEQLWAWGRVAGERGLPFVRRNLADGTHEQVRKVALELVSLHLDREAIPLVRSVLASPSSSASNRRVAAEFLGRMGDKESVPALLGAADTLLLPATPDAPPQVDRALEHSLIYALIEIGDAPATAKGLVSDNPRAQRLALIALDQIPGGGTLTAEQVLARLDSAEPLLHETANWLVARHPEWGGALAGWFAKELAAVRREGDGGNVETLLTRHAGHPAIRDLLAASATDAKLSELARLLVLRVMAAAKPAELPPIWGDALAKNIAEGSSPVAHQAVVTAGSIPAGKKPHVELQNALQSLAADPGVGAATRLAAMAAVVGGMPEVNDEQFGLLRAGLEPDRAVVDRSAAAEALSKAKLNAEQLRAVAEAIKTVGPLELDRLLAPFEKSTDDKIGLLLLDALKKASSLSSLRIDSLQQKLAKYGPAVQEKIGEVVVLVNVDIAAQRKQLEERLATVSTGDVRRGQAVFNSSKAACTACHRFGYLGGSTGPDLTRIGGIRTERDLLESIMFPSLSFVRSYEPVMVVTNDGRVVNGLIKDESPTELLLSTGPNQEARVTRADIEEVRPSTVSVMPAGLDKQLTPQELADLVAFLKNAK